MNEQTSRFIDSARGLAALFVMASHVGICAFLAFPDGPDGHGAWLAPAVEFLQATAHHSVVVFFVLSGFLVGGSALARAERGERLLGGYLVDRSLRIYVVLVPALVLTAFLDTLRHNAFGSEGAFADGYFAHAADPANFILNLLNLQHIFGPTFGSNMPLWSLSHEFWFYVTFGLVAVGLSRGYAPSARRAALLFALAVLILPTLYKPQHIFWFAMWLGGVAAARLPRSKMAPALALVLFAGLGVFAILLLRGAALDKWAISIALDSVAASVFIGLLLSRRFDDAPPGRFLLWRGNRALSSLSYSLYAAHTPIVIFLFAVARRLLGPTPSTPALVAATLIVFLATLAAARLFWRLTEAHTGTIRGAVHRALAARRPVAEGLSP